MLLARFPIINSKLSIINSKFPTKNSIFPIKIKNSKIKQKCLIRMENKHNVELWSISPDPPFYDFEFLLGHIIYIYIYRSCFLLESRI